jgi:hypothetical protein
LNPRVLPSASVCALGIFLLPKIDCSPHLLFPPTLREASGEHHRPTRLLPPFSVIPSSLPCPASSRNPCLPGGPLPAACLSAPEVDIPSASAAALQSILACAGLSLPRRLQPPVPRCLVCPRPVACLTYHWERRREPACSVPCLPGRVSTDSACHSRRAYSHPGRRAEPTTAPLAVTSLPAASDPPSPQRQRASKRARYGRRSSGPSPPPPRRLADRHLPPGLPYSRSLAARHGNLWQAGGYA